MFLAALLIYLLSYLFILEPYNVLEDTISSDSPYADRMYYPTLDTFYFIDNGDGTYDVYSGDMFLETTDSIEYYPPGTPIYTPDTAPTVQ